MTAITLAKLFSDKRDVRAVKFTMREKRHQMKSHIRSFLPAFAIICFSFLNRLSRFNSGREHHPNWFIFRSTERRRIGGSSGR